MLGATRGEKPTQQLRSRVPPPIARLSQEKHKAKRLQYHSGTT
jgi:hypothetical protein